MGKRCDSGRESREVMYPNLHLHAARRDFAEHRRGKDYACPALVSLGLGHKLPPTDQAFGPHRTNHAAPGRPVQRVKTCGQTQSVSATDATGAQPNRDMRTPNQSYRFIQTKLASDGTLHNEAKRDVMPTHAHASRRFIVHATHAL
jgi:hypothetical protein